MEEQKLQPNLTLKISYLSPLIFYHLQCENSRELAISTDAKYRFERGIDPNSVKEGLQSATDLILLCGGQASKFNIIKNYQNNKIINEVENFENLIGIPMSSNEAQKNLNSLGFTLKVKKDLKLKFHHGD